MKEQDFSSDELKMLSNFHSRLFPTRHRVLLGWNWISDFTAGSARSTQSLISSSAPD